MLLTELSPRFVNAGGPGITNAQGKPVTLQKGIGMSFNCPCGCSHRGYVDFVNPLDGSKNRSKSLKWARTGDDFATMTLHPSIQRSGGHSGCGWHGWFKQGQVIEA